MEGREREETDLPAALLTEHPHIPQAAPPLSCPDTTPPAWLLAPPSSHKLNTWARIPPPCLVLHSLHLHQSLFSASQIIPGAPLPPRLPDPNLEPPLCNTVLPGQSPGSEGATSCCPLPSGWTLVSDWHSEHPQPQPASLPHSPYQPSSPKSASVLFSELTWPFTLHFAPAAAAS